MKVDKVKAYSFELVLMAILFACAFTNSSNTKFVLMIVSLVGAIVVSFVLKKEPNTYTNKDKVFKVMIVFAVLYIALFYVLGIYTGYYRAAYMFGVKTLLTFIIPMTVTIICTEFIRNKLLTVKTRLSRLLTVIITTLIDVLFYLYVYNISRYEEFLAVVGFLTFSSLAANILYNYLNPRYGKKVIIAYKLITTLYIYIIPITPNVYIFFRTFMRLVYPLFIYLHLETYYNPDKEQELIRDRKKGNFSLGFAMVVMTILIALVSCKFMYGALVIGSGSMTGSLDVGDVILFKNDKKDLKAGDIIVFVRDGRKVVHRISKIKYVNKGNVYFTKGDANQYSDEGYVVEDELLGKVVGKIPKIGMPTLWFRDQFK